MTPDLGQGGDRRPIYFGCYRDVGHHFREVGGGHTRLSYSQMVEWLGVGQVDGRFYPSAKQGECLLHYVNGWNVLAFADRTVDDRGGSSSVFFLPGDRLTFEQAVEAARQHFPSVIARQPVPLHEASR